MKRVVLVCSALVACGKHQSASPVANHAGSSGGEPPGERGYVIDAGSLVEVSATGSRVVEKGIVACNTDARAQVVWFVSNEGVSALDLVDGTVHPVIKHDLAVRTPDGVEHTRIEPIIDWGNEKLGGESGLDFDVGIAVKLTAKPALEMVEGCEGDRAVYCQDENGNPTPNIVDAQKVAESLKLADPTYVAKLAARGEKGHLWTTPAASAQPPKPPTIDPSRCEEIPEDCGKLTPVPGTGLWLVGTANSRGDYFHLTRELWDPATGEFVRVANGKLIRTSKLPDDSDGTDYGGLRVSPSGLMSLNGVIFDAHHVLYAPHSSDDGTPATCGFSSGYRIKGPTDG